MQYTPLSGKGVGWNRKPWGQGWGSCGPLSGKGVGWNRKPWGYGWGRMVHYWAGVGSYAVRGGVSIIGQGSGWLSYDGVSDAVV